MTNQRPDPLVVPLHGRQHDGGGVDSIGVVPLWGILLWPTAKAIPERFHRADGTFGTTDLTASEPASHYYITRVT